MQVEIWSDVVCPWCYIGKRRFETALEQFTEAHPDVEVEVAYRSFMLDPNAPVGESEPVRQAYEKKFGGPEMAQGILDKVTNEAAGEGVEFNMDIAKRSNTLLAHRLLVLAESKGVQLELKERLLAAYFTEGKAIGETAVLVDEAVAVGLDRAECEAWLAGDGGRADVAEHLEFAAANGLSSVPTFVFDRRSAVPGAQAPELFLQVMEERLTASAAEAE
ncbi:MAG: DsbA family oxidoreductase [Actinomycetota bacterium]